jgi:DNA-binding CsgD family transcriptional regulator
MSAKLQYRPLNAPRSPFSDSALASAPESLTRRIHQIQNSAKQICTDAADIEDARFLAENIIDACRRILANDYASNSDRGTVAGLPAAPGGPAEPASPASVGNPDAAKKSAAREKLAALSGRELEIFAHLAEGRSAAEIAVRLSRSSKTINNHRTRILHKLGLKNATELVRLAVGAGLVSV